MSKFRKLPEEVRRRQILDAALEVFSGKTYDTVSMNELARAAGMTKGGVYFHFASKEEVFTAMVEEELDRRWRHLDAVAREAADLSPAEALQHMLMRWMTPGHRPELLTPTILATCIAMDRPREAFLRQNERVGAIIGRLMERLLDDLDIQVDPHDLADLLLMIRIGAIWKESTAPDRKPGDPPTASGALARVIAALAQRGGSR